MTEDELNHRRAGFMTAIGLMTENADPGLREQLLETLRSIDTEKLQTEISSGNFPEVDGINPCPPGYYWDPALQLCVPIIDDPA